MNAEGKGLVRIKYIGGPEAVPPNQQSTAVRNGMIDLQLGPPAYYLGQVPEADAMFGSNVTPWTSGQMVDWEFATKFGASG